MPAPKRTFREYDLGLHEVMASENRVANRRALAARESCFDSYVRPVLVGLGLVAITDLSRMAAIENKEWLERKCEQVYSFIGIPMSSPYEEVTEILD
jgi:hypothetical protein